MIVELWVILGFAGVGVILGSLVWIFFKVADAIDRDINNWKEKNMDLKNLLSRLALIEEQIEKMREHLLILKRTLYYYEQLEKQKGHPPTQQEIEDFFNEK